MKKNGIKLFCMLAGLLLGCQALSGCGNQSVAPGKGSEYREYEESAFHGVKSIIKDYGNTWTDANDYFSKAITQTIPETALLGNGDIGVTSYGAADRKTFLVSKGNFWNCGDGIASDGGMNNSYDSKRIAGPRTLGSVTLQGR